MDTGDTHIDNDQRAALIAALAAQAGSMDFAAFRSRLDELARFLVYNLGDRIYKETT